MSIFREVPPDATRAHIDQRVIHANKMAKKAIRRAEFHRALNSDQRLNDLHEADRKRTEKRKAKRK